MLSISLNCFKKCAKHLQLCFRTATSHLHSSAIFRSHYFGECIFKSILTDCISCNGFYALNPKTFKRKKKQVLIYIALMLTLICSILKAPPSMCSSAFPVPALQCPKKQGGSMLETSLIQIIQQHG